MARAAGAHHTSTSTLAGLLLKRTLSGRKQWCDCRKGTAKKRTFKIVILQDSLSLANAPRGSGT
eukprot:680467-Amphidinium_carterae.1